MEIWTKCKYRKNRNNGNKKPNGRYAVINTGKANKKRK